MYKKMYLIFAIPLAAFGQEGYHKYLNLQRIKSSSIVAPSALGKLSLYYASRAFKIKHNKKLYDIENCWVDPMLRGIDTQRLGAFLRAGYISINKLDSGEYMLRGHVKGHGGGPIAGAIAYWVTKSLCYGTAVAAAGTAVVATGGALGAASGAIVTAGTLGASSGATIVGGAIAGAGLAGEAAVVTTGVVTGAGGVAGAVALVESASVAACTVFTVIPFLP